MKNKNFDFLELEILPYLDFLKGKSLQYVIDYVKKNWSDYKLVKFDWQGIYYFLNNEQNVVYKQNLLEL